MQIEEAKADWFYYVASCVAAIRSIADQHGIECRLYTPQDVKYAATNDKNADKNAVQRGVKKICNLKELPKSHHSADAIAASLCYLRSHLNSSRFEGNKRKEGHWNKGCAYLDKNQYDAAVSEFKEAINIDPIYTEAHCSLASAYLGQDNLEEAENAVNEALRLDPNYRLAHKHLEAIKQAYYKQGIAYLNDQQYDSAITAFNKVVRIDPNFIDVYCKLGWAYLGRDNLRFAENSTKTAPDIEDDYDIWEFEFIMGYPKENDLVSAEKSANEALRLDSRYQHALDLLEDIKQTYYNRGLNHLDNLQYDEAITAFKETINRYPKFTAAHCGLGLAYLRRGELEKAEKSAKQASELDSAHRSVRELLDMIKRTYCDRGRTHLAQGNLEAATKSVVEALKFEYNNWSFHIIRSSSIQIGILRRGTNYQPAQELLDLIKQAYYNRGCCHLNKKQYNEAASQFRIVADMDSDYKNVQNYLGYAYYWIHDFKNSIRSYQIAIAINSNDKNAYVMLGLAHIRAGNYSKAVTRFQEAIDIDLNHKLAHLCLGRAYFKIGKLEEAKQSIRQTLDIDPTYQRALRLLEEIKEREIRGQKQLVHL